MEVIEKLVKRLRNGSEASNSFKFFIIHPCKEKSRSPISARLVTDLLQALDTRMRERKLKTIENH